MRTHQRESKFKPSKFELEDVEDYYTFYVLILQIPEDVFWFADISFVMSVVENKQAYDGWRNYVEQREFEKSKRK